MHQHINILGHQCYFGSSAQFYCGHLPLFSTWCFSVAPKELSPDHLQTDSQAPYWTHWIRNSKCGAWWTGFQWALLVILILTECCWNVQRSTNIISKAGRSVKSLCRYPWPWDIVEFLKLVSASSGMKLEAFSVHSANHYIMEPLQLKLSIAVVFFFN